MADPVALGALGVSTAVGILGASTSASGAEYAAQAEATKARYQAGVAAVNATIAKQNAQYDLASGEVQAEESGMRTAQQIGGAKAAFGASNVAGASKDNVIKSQIEIGTENQGIIRADAAKRAYGQEVTAAEDVSQGQLYGLEEQTALTAGDISATSSLISGFGSVASKWLGATPAFTKGGPGSGTQLG